MVKRRLNSCLQKVSSKKVSRTKIFNHFVKRLPYTLWNTLIRIIDVCLIASALFHIDIIYLNSFQRFSILISLYLKAKRIYEFQQFRDELACMNWWALQIRRTMNDNPTMDNWESHLNQKWNIFRTTVCAKPRCTGWHGSRSNSYVLTSYEIVDNYTEYFNIWNFNFDQLCVIYIIVA